MAFAMQGQEYKLVRCLTDREDARVFLVVNPVGDQLILKCHTCPNQFFDELARYYACDSPYLCKILYNHPPYLISGDDFAFQKEITSCFGVDLGELKTPQDMANSEMSMVGTLVLEFVEGQPISEVFPRLDLEEKHHYMDQLTRALESLHRHGEHHGNLMPENVILNERARSLRLIDLGFTHGVSPWEPGYQSPEHDPNSNQVLGPASDIYMLANNFMNDPAFQTKKGEKLIRECLRPGPHRRPAIASIRRELGYEKNRSTLLNRSFRWAAVACMVLASIIAITVTRVDSFVELKDHYLSEMDRNPKQAIEDLIRLREEHMEHGQALTRAIAIAKKNNHYQVRQMLDSDMAAPIAVIALPQRPMFIGRHEVYELGDWVQIGNREGYISNIGFQGFHIQTDTEQLSFPFQLPGISLNQDFYRAGILVWKNENNLGRLIESLPALPDMLGEKAAVINKDLGVVGVFERDRVLQIADSSLYGFFAVNSFSEFVDRLSEQLHIDKKEDSLEITLSSDHLPVYRQFQYLNLDNTTVAKLGGYFEEELGFPFEVSPEIRDVLLRDKKFFDKNWRQILEELRLQWKITNENGSKKITIQSIN